jgi:translation initiation factor 2B subunit (eIF-2B alpha/beta/delta family)
MASVNFPVPKLLFDGLRNVAKVLGEAGKIPLQQTVLEAYEQIHTLLSRVHDLEEKLRETENELKQIRKTQASAVGAVRWAEHFWLYKDDSPCCLYCWEKQNRLFHVIPVPIKGIFRETKCPECGTRIERVPRRSYWQTEREEHLAGLELQPDLEAARATEAEQS